jgi:hypothetical protein
MQAKVSRTTAATTSGSFQPRKLATLADGITQSSVSPNCISERMIRSPEAVGNLSFGGRAPH